MHRGIGIHYSLNYSNLKSSTLRFYRLNVQSSAHDLRDLNKVSCRVTMHYSEFTKKKIPELLMGMYKCDDIKENVHMVGGYV